MTRVKDPSPSRFAALKITAVYAAAGTLWILCTAWLLHHFVHDELRSATLEVVKGMLYVLVTATVLGWWLHRYFRRIRGAAALLRKSETRFATIFEDSPMAVAISRMSDGEFLDANEAFARLLGHPRGEIIGRTSEQLGLWPSDNRPQAFEELRERGRVVAAMQGRRRNGEVLDLTVTLQRIELDGETCVLGTLVDVTERRKAESALRDSEARMRLFIEHAPAALAMFDRDMRYLAASHRWLSDYGLEGTDILGRSHYEVFPEIGEALKQIHLRGLSGEVMSADDARFERADGSVQYLRWEMHPWRDDLDRIGGIVIVSEDVTERKRAETALRESEERFRSLIEGAPEAAFVQCGGIFRYVNQAMVRLMGATRTEDLVGHPFVDRMAPEYLDAIRERIRLQQETGRTAPPMEQEYVRLDGTRVPVETTAVAFRYEGQDGHLVFVRDITARRVAEAERSRLDAQLRQAQKLESVGRLAGGVAHDFNNLLMGIMNYTELCRDGLPADHPVRPLLDEITAEAQRSAGITRQLLAFARRQTIVPVVLDLNDHVAGTLRMLQRLIGEDIDLTWHPGAREALVRMDPSQIDQILTNLALNARDAMDGAGRITVETGCVSLDEAYCARHEGARPGAHVLLTVSDSGVGMDRETLAHIFEPFYSTKPDGKGTGLGLATVYGIVEQNDGHIDVQSEPGRGTTFRIHLPRHAGGAGEEKPPEGPRELPGGSETILLVEDETSVRVTTALLLASLGYDVLSAGDPEDALRQAAEHRGAIHLLITDVVMPGMNGRDLAARLSGLQPDLACLYVSGYTEDVIGHRGILDEGVHFLAKPFTRGELARNVREALQDRPAGDGQ